MIHGTSTLHPGGWPEFHLHNDPGALARMIDIGAVQAQHTATDLRVLARAALAGNYVAAHVLPAWVPLLPELLDGSTTKWARPSASPRVARPPRSRSRRPSGWYRRRRRARRGDQRRPAALRPGPGSPTTCASSSRRWRPGADEGDHGDPHLDDDAVRCGCAAALVAGARSVKSGTGWAGNRTSVREVRMIREAVGPQAEVKASGGIRRLAMVREMLAAGATRFGMNAVAAASLLEDAALVGEEG